MVVHHEHLCLGCRYCEMTCPFATPTYDRAKGVVSKCHLCAHRVDAGRLPACVAACPTGALRYVAAATTEGHAAGTLDFVPGFADPAGCRPALRFLAPSGARRAELFRSLEEALKR
jgi:Fe-S-cluster-containing dehydrogenase component